VYCFSCVSKEGFKVQERRQRRTEKFSLKSLLSFNSLWTQLFISKINETNKLTLIWHWTDIERYKRCSLLISSPLIRNNLQCASECMQMNLCSILIQLCADVRSTHPCPRLCRSFCALSVLPGGFALLPLTPFSVPHPNFQSRVSLALLKLPLGNLTPCAKPKMLKVPTHTHKHTQALVHTQTLKTQAVAADCVLNVGVTWLCSHCSLLHQWGRYRWALW